MNDFTNMKNLIIGGLVVIIVGFAAYSYLLRSRVVSDDTLVSVSSSQVASVENSFIRALSSLKRIKFEADVFDHPTWNTFTDFGQTLAPQPVGRANPFAPIDSATLSQ